MPFVFTWGSLWVLGDASVSFPISVSISGFTYGRPKKLTQSVLFSKTVFTNVFQEILFVEVLLWATSLCMSICSVTMNMTQNMRVLIVFDDGSGTTPPTSRSESLTKQRRLNVFLSCSEGRSIFKHVFCFSKCFSYIAFDVFQIISFRLSPLSLSLAACLSQSLPLNACTIDVFLSILAPEILSSF